MDYLKPRAISVVKAAKRLGVSEGCIRNMVRRGELRHFKAGRLIRVPTDAIEALENGEPDPGVKIDDLSEPVSTPRKVTVRTPSGRVASCYVDAPKSKAAKELKSVTLPNGRRARLISTF